jgi:hypothetical protein
MNKYQGNTNHIVTHGFSNPESEWLYEKQWPSEPEALEFYRTGRSCLACNYFAPLNKDWGICCYQRSRHFLETISEHFTCKSYVRIEPGEGMFQDRHLYQKL